MRDADLQALARQDCPDAQAEYWERILRSTGNHRFPLGPISPLRAICAQEGCDELSSLSTCSFCENHSSDEAYIFDHSMTYQGEHSEGMLRTSWVHDVGVVEELAEWLLRNRNTANDIRSRWRRLMYNRNEYQGPKQPKITECMDYVLCCCCHDDIDTTHPIDRFPRRDF